MNNWCICWFFMHPLHGELNPTCQLLALLGGATIVVVSRLRVKEATFARQQQAPDCRQRERSGGVTPRLSPSQPTTISPLNFLHCFFIFPALFPCRYCLL